MTQPNPQTLENLLHRGMASTAQSAMRLVALFAIVFLLRAPLVAAQQSEAPARWSQAQAQRWYQAQPWLVGSNYIPADAINQLEMWQAESYHPARIDLELSWAESIGMNTMRVFLHDELWQQDPEGFKKRIDSFLTIAARHHIRPVFVLFDSCWDPYPHLGPQHPPIPGVHNSGWVQSPGAELLRTPQQQDRLRDYVQGIVGSFAHDQRILAWDLWNEPDNDNASSYGRVELKDKSERVAQLLPKVFAWARAVHPEQPLTSGVWHGDWSMHSSLSAINRIQLEESDIITFHNYDWPEGFEQAIKSLLDYGRPIICTEYMARGAGSLFETILPVAQKYHVGAINWGFVQGKTQTNLPWDSWQHPYTTNDPTIWFHDIYHTDGRPYRAAEVQTIRRLTSSDKTQPTSR